jgi:hypothetical protein
MAITTAVPSDHEIEADYEKEEEQFPLAAKRPFHKEPSPIDLNHNNPDWRVQIGHDRIPGLLVLHKCRHEPVQIEHQPSRYGLSQVWILEQLLVLLVLRVPSESEQRPSGQQVRLQEAPVGLLH